MGLEEDIAKYADAARKHGQATTAGDSVATNRAYRELSIAWKKIAQSKSNWHPAFFNLLENENAWVRLWAASHAIHIDAGRSLPVLEALVAEPGFLGFDAQMTLEQWRKGKLGGPQV